MIQNIFIRIAEAFAFKPAIGYTGSSASLAAGVSVLTGPPSWIATCSAIAGLILIVVGIIGGTLTCMIQYWNWKHRKELLNSRGFDRRK